MAAKDSERRTGDERRQSAGRAPIDAKAMNEGPRIGGPTDATRKGATATDETRPRARHCCS